MGCDIHDYAERLNKKTGRWEKLGDVFPHPYYDPKTQKDFPRNKFHEHPFYSRNYDLFAILADVRNGVGFGGCETGGGFNPISEPKGLPEDVSKEIKKESDRWDGDGHSHSYLTVKELLDYDWNQSTKHIGWVNVSGYLEYKEKGEPSTWSGGVSGPKVKHISEKEMDDVIKKLKKKKSNKYLPVSVDIDYYTKISWGVKYKDCVGKSFFKHTIPLLKKLAKKDTESVRIVFWFDN